MADEQADRIKALLEERRGYELHGKAERVAEVDAELRRLGAGGRPPVKRAVKRPAVKKGSSR